MLDADAAHFWKCFLRVLKALHFAQYKLGSAAQVRNRMKPSVVKVDTNFAQLLRRRSSPTRKRKRKQLKKSAN